MNKFCMCILNQYKNAHILQTSPLMGIFQVKQIFSSNPNRIFFGIILKKLFVSCYCHRKLSFFFWSSLIRLYRLKYSIFICEIELLFQKTCIYIPLSAYKFSECCIQIQNLSQIWQSGQLCESNINMDINSKPLAKAIT